MEKEEALEIIRRKIIGIEAYINKELSFLDGRDVRGRSYQQLDEERLRSEIARLRLVEKEILKND
jgi:hypothetical protein